MSELKVLKNLIAEKDNTSKQQLKKVLVAYINGLLVNDFEKLLQLLYRTDVNEEKLKALLKQYPDQDAAMLITDLLIERELQKKSTRENQPGGSNICDEEKW
jgi:transposase